MRRAAAVLSWGVAAREGRVSHWRDSKPTTLGRAGEPCAVGSIQQPAVAELVPSLDIGPQLLHL